MIPDPQEHSTAGIFEENKPFKILSQLSVQSE